MIESNGSIQPGSKACPPGRGVEGVAVGKGVAVDAGVAVIEGLAVGEGVVVGEGVGVGDGVAAPEMVTFLANTHPTFPSCA